MQESIEAMVARINSSAFFHAESFSYVKHTKKPKKKPKKKKATQLEQLSERDQKLLIGLLDGSLRMLVIHGAQYAVKLGIQSIVSSVTEPVDYTVEGDRCTCPDSRYRERVCKHAEAVNAEKARLSAKI